MHRILPGSLSVILVGAWLLLAIASPVPIWGQDRAPATDPAPVKNQATAKIRKAAKNRGKTKGPKRNRPKKSLVHPLNTTLLPNLLESRGYRPGPHFKGLIISIVPSETAKGYEYYPYDFRKTSIERDTWWPASTVKLFAAIAALEKARRMGFTPRAELTFYYEDGAQTNTLKNLIEHALTFSHNIHFNRLVEFVGFETLNREFLTRRNGFPNTVMLRSYSGRWRNEETGHGSNRHSPRILIREGEDKTEIIEERHGTGSYSCRDQGNCTSLRELSEAMRRVMMHRHLPKSERYFLSRKALALLKKAMSQDRPKGHGGVVAGLKKGFGQRPVEIFHKGGFAYDWYSDNIFIRATDTGELWQVALANYPGRGALDEAAFHVGALLAEGTLAKHRAGTAQKRSDRPQKHLEQCVHAIK